MKKPFAIHLLGGLAITQDGSPIPKLVSRKADVLLAYLAQEPRTHSRESLATLLWDDRPQKRALSNLRTLITSLRKHAEPFVDITRRTLALADGVWVDTAVFQQQLSRAQETWPSMIAAEQMEETLGLYVGDFLEGVLVSDSNELEEWIQFSREQLRQQAMEARQQLVAYYLQQGATNDGMRHAAILLEMDPWNEETHRQMMQLLARSGQRQAALAQYETCVQLLDEELGIPPEPETTALYERIQTAVSTPTASLPAIATTFVGREKELGLCLEQLHNPDCRLLTLVGLGGMGKTRLALQAASAVQMDFLNGVYFVPLAVVASPDGLATAVAEALPVSFYDTKDIETQLLNYLRGKELLLVLDNFEHLLAGATLLIKILHQAPTVKLLVTSRLRLDLKAEWLIELGGLPYPVDATAAAQATAHYAATRLFEQRAQVIASDFALTADNLPSINRICQIVHGIPLGVELAAAWIRFMSVDKIAEQIAQNLDLLTTTMRDVPERQRSLTAVFDSVWSLLTEEEQTIFAMLSVFRGSFDLDAFRAVTAGSPWGLAALVEKSMLHKGENGRYSLIEALRLYATTKLADLPEIRQQTQARHSHYYTSLLHQQETLLESRQTQAALQVIRHDLGNIQAAWADAVAACHFADLAQSHHSLMLFYIYRGPYQEGDLLLATAVDQLTARLQAEPQPDPVQAKTLAQLHNSRARLAHYTANYEIGMASARAAIAWGERIEDVASQAAGYLSLGVITERKGEYETAVAHLQKAITLAQQIQDDDITAEAHRAWGFCLQRQSEYDAAKEQYLIGLQMAQHLQRPQIIAGCLRGLGNVSRIFAENDTAREYYEEAIAIARDMGDLVSLNAGLFNLANIAASAGDYAAAAQGYRQVLPFYQQMGNRYMEAICLINIAGNTFQLNQFHVALKIYQQALALTQEIGNRWVEHVCLMNAAEVLNALGRYQQALEYGRAAVEFFEEIEETMARSYGLNGLGETLIGLNQFDEAVTVLQEAVAIRREFKHQLNVVGSLAALARAYLAQGDKQQAAIAIEEVIQYIDEGHSLVGSDATLRIYEACYLVLQANDDARQSAILRKAYEELLARANCIQDEEVRQTHLESTPWHKMLMQTFAAQ